MWKNILVPHDFSPCAASALRLAGDLARLHRGEIWIVHVSELPENLSANAVIAPPGEESPLLIGEFLTRGAVRRLEQIAEPLRSEGLAVRTKAVTGKTVEEILTTARDVDADLLVVGTHGRGGLSHLFLGSVAEQLVRRAAVPVITVRSPGPEVERTREERAAEDELAG